MVRKLTGRFEDLLLAYSPYGDPDEQRRIHDTLWKEYGSEQAVSVLDMSGFSLLTQEYGIVHYLSMIRRMQLTTLPIVESHNGRVVKFEADNCFGVFPDSLSAVRAGIAMNLAFEAANILTPDNLDIRICCGIDFGRILMVGDDDFFGNAVNRASKLGEDVAGPGEVLVAKEAMDRIPKEAGIRGREINLSVSGIELQAYVVEYQPK